MKSFCTIVLRALLFTCLVLGFAACEQPAGLTAPDTSVPAATPSDTPSDTPPPVDPPPALVSLSVASPPEMIYYARGQEFDSRGLVVEGDFDDETTRELETDEYELIPPDMGLSGPKRVTVKAGEFSASFPIIVNNSVSVLQSITVTPPEGGLIQYLGKSLDTEGLTVTCHFNDGDRILKSFSTSGYDRTRRGEQTVTVSVNGQTGTFPVRVKIPEDATITAVVLGTDPNPLRGHDTVFIKGQSLQMAQAKIRATVTANGTTAVLYSGNGIEFDEITGYDSARPGRQTLTLTLDDASASLPVYVTDIEPEIYFDHGFMRTAEDPTGRGRARDEFLGDGAYHTTLQSPTLVLTPVRVLIGYDADHKDLSPVYEWTVTPNTDWTVSGPNGEFLHFDPPTTGTWEVSVRVTGRNYVDGLPITKTATTQVICDSPLGSPVLGGLDLKNFAPGQFTESGNGYGWSLGTIGGYWAWATVHRTRYTIEGNAFPGWSEQGVVWFQEDRNGNGKPDEIWYELGGRRSRYVTRPYSIKFFKSGDGAILNEYNQILRDVYWVDNKGRTGKKGFGWPKDWGVSDADGAWVTYTATLLADEDIINTEHYRYFLGGPDPDEWGVNGSTVDSSENSTFYINQAVDAAGALVKLTNVRFIKVQTAIFRYGGVFGEVSTEIASHD
jgi:hypothetical protein